MRALWAKARGSSSLLDRTIFSEERRWHLAAAFAVSDEADTLEVLLNEASLGDSDSREVERRARDIVAHVRAHCRNAGGNAALMTLEES